MRLLGSPVTQGDQEVVREERFKMVSSRIIHCAWIVRTEYGLSNGGGWKHADCLILMEGAFATAVNVWHYGVNYWGPGFHQRVLCNPCSNPAQISLVPAVLEEPVR